MPRRKAVLVAALLFSGALGAQTHRVAKQEKVTRAIAVYEWTGDLNKPTASRLVPVSLFIEGNLQDAGVYLPRPVPFALQPGNVYSIEKAGEPVGTLDLDSARNIVTARAASDDNPAGAWYAFGRFQPPPAAAKTPPLHTTAHPGAIVASSADGRPHLSSRTGTDTKASDENTGGSAGKSSSGKTPSSTPTEPASGSPSPAPPVNDNDPDRPHMSRRDNTASSTADDTPARTSSTETASASGDDPERPTLRRRTPEPEEKKKRGKESGSGVRPLATSLNDDPDRPTLGRGSLNTPAATPELTGLPADMHQAVAVSDASTIDNHPFAREWESAAERSNTLAALEGLARPRVTNYLTLNALHPGTPAHVAAGPTTATDAAENEGAAPRLRRGRPIADAQPASAPSTPASTSHSTAASQAAKARPHAASAGTATLLLTSEQLSGYTLSYGGLPTFTYSATTPTAEGSPVYITLVAQQLPSGELQVALSSVTDEAHLNREPGLRLVDVVDPNNSHRASLLFELRGKGSRQFALYNLVTAKAEQAFVTRLIE